MSLSPFEHTRSAANSFGDPRIKSQLLAELAQLQLATGQFESAIQTFSDIPDSLERRIALLIADFRTPLNARQPVPFTAEHVQSLVELLESDLQTSKLAGRLAKAMLDAGRTDAAWLLVETATDPFESDEQQYEFFEAVLLAVPPGDWSRITRLYRSFSLGSIRDWATLAVLKYLTNQGRHEEAQRYADSLVMPLRHSWAYWEMSRQTEGEMSGRYFDQACRLVEEIEIDTNDDLLEVLAVQLRIFGRMAFEKGNRDSALLERSEAAAAAVIIPIQKYRLQCFLGKVLAELGIIDSISNYLPIESILASLSSEEERSRVLVWLAEAGLGVSAWEGAVEALSHPQRGVLESDRALQLAGVIKRYTAHVQNLPPMGNPGEDAVRLSGEEFEARYFNPFAEADCGCY